MYGTSRAQRLVRRCAVALLVLSIGMVVPTSSASAATLVYVKAQWTRSDLGFINSSCGSSAQIVTVNQVSYRAPSGIKGAPLHVGETFMLHLETAVVANDSCSFGELFKTTVLLPGGLVPAATTAPAVTCVYSNADDVLLTKITPCDSLTKTNVAGIWTFATSRNLVNHQAVHYFFPVVATKPLSNAKIQLKSTLTQNKHGLVPSFMLANLGVTVGASSVPSAPRSVRAEPRNAAAAVYWTAPVTNGGKAITKYTVIASPGGRSCTTTGTGRSCAVTGLSNKATYTFKVRATNVLGNSPLSAATNSIVAGTPTAPRSLRATFPAAGAANVAWTAPASLGSGPLVRYESRVSVYVNGAWTPFPTTWDNERLVLADNSIRGGRSGLQIRIQLRAVNGSGAGLVASLQITLT